MNSRSLSLLGLVAAIVVIGLVALTADDDPGAVPRSVATEPLDRLTVAPIDTGADTVVAPPDLPDRGLHRDLVDIDGWLQSDVTSLEELRGRVVAVQFWTFGCSNCKATLPHVQALEERYASDDFEIVGVHSPEFSYEQDVDRIRDAAAELGVTWPIVLDTHKRTFHEWQDGPRAFWPRMYVLDRDGHVRYDHVGEGHYDEIEAVVAALLAEPAT